MKGKSSIVLLVFSLVCFGLLLSDVASRFEETSDLETVKVVSDRSSEQTGNQQPIANDEPTPEELKQLIKESLMGEAGG
jgi:hypothetical protein